jgi:hypothetical protein
MFKRILTLCFCFIFSVGCLTGCASDSSNNLNRSSSVQQQTSTPLNNGKYPVQQASIDDADGEYTLMLLNTPPGASPVFRTQNLQMARLTEEEINNGEKTYVEIKGDQAVMHLTEDFRIEYIHNETQVVENPNTGRQETVVVRRESSFWTPFAGAMAGQALGSLLFTPRYYMPPAYVAGSPLSGVGGYGSSYNQAVQSYRSNYNTAPAIEKNRQSFRKTGSLKTNTNASRGIRKSGKNNLRSTGSGFGSSKLKTNGNSNKFKQPSRNSFGTRRPRPNTFRRRAPMRRSFGRRR